MSVFTSPREKRFWLYTLLVVLALVASLFFGGSLALSMEEELQGALFFCAMLAVGVTVLISGLKRRADKVEWATWLGLFAVYLMMYARLGFAERSHLFEYSVLAIFIYQAMMERVEHGKDISFPAIVAFIIAFGIGALDEASQWFIPDRVFDVVDILFNSLAAFMAITSSKIIFWLRKKSGFRSQ